MKQSKNTKRDLIPLKVEFIQKFQWQRCGVLYEIFFEVSLRLFGIDTLKTKISEEICNFINRSCKTIDHAYLLKRNTKNALNAL